MSGAVVCLFHSNHFTMAKSQNSQKQTKKQPLKSAAEKKADKRAKKSGR